MKQSNFMFIKYFFSFCFALLILAVFVPRKYKALQFLKLKNVQFFELKTGSKITYTHLVAQGTKKPFPIIYLHGGPGGFISEREIKILEPLTNDGFEIYLYDQIGSGLSERLSDIEEYTADRHKKDLEELIKKIGAEKVILIGQSWGAVLFTLYIADNPNKVDKAILIGPGPIQPTNFALLNINPPDSLKLTIPTFTNKEANEKSKNIRSSAVAFCARTFGKKLASDNEMDNFQTLLNSELNKATVRDTTNALNPQGVGGFYAQIMTIQSLTKIQDARPKLKSAHVSVLIMKGQFDNQPWGFVNEYLEIFPNHLLKIIPDAGHAISVEQPEKYIKTIREFLIK